MTRLWSERIWIAENWSHTVPLGSWGLIEELKVGQQNPRPSEAGPQILGGLAESSFMRPAIYEKATSSLGPELRLGSIFLPEEWTVSGRRSKYTYWRRLESRVRIGDALVSRCSRTESEGFCNLDPRKGGPCMLGCIYRMGCGGICLHLVRNC